MKKLILFLFIAVPAFIFGQSAQHKNSITFGFGFQQYNGDLGNTFFATDEEWYGVGRITYNRYLNRFFDAQGVATLGDYGHCFDGVQDPNHPVLNMRSRLNVLGAGIKLKTDNGSWLKESSKLAPYITAGVAFNNIKDRWTKEQNRVNGGNYMSLNSSVGLNYKISERIHLNYNLNLGYFTSDKLDFINKGSNDSYLQNTLSLGINL